jgi:serine/threonine protein kinase
MHVHTGAPHGEPDGSLAGTVIDGRFTLETPAGRGGMGTVYRATDSLSGQPVALKLLHLAPSADTARRFAREAELLSTLRHPGIVAYVAHGHTEQEQPFLAMEWLDGEDLAQRLTRPPLSLAETLSLLRHTARALTVAHQHGVIHRDLKPSNLFLRQGRPEEVVLLDFGLARHVLPSVGMTASQMLLGTPGYMAPEQATGQTKLTPGADIFSLGCVLYECLTGQPPFRGPNLVATLARILFNEPTPLRELRPELPAALQELLERMLAKEPAHRLPDASSLLSELEALQARLGVAPDGGFNSRIDDTPSFSARHGRHVEHRLTQPFSSLAVGENGIQGRNPDRHAHCSGQGVSEAEGRRAVRGASTSSFGSSQALMRFDFRRGKPC